MHISKNKSSTSNLCLQSFAFLNLVTSSHAKFRTINLLQPMQSHYQLVIFASDGLWEHLTDPEVVEIVGSTSHSHMEHGAWSMCYLLRLYSDEIRLPQMQILVSERSNFHIALML